MDCDDNAYTCSICDLRQNGCVAKSLTRRPGGAQFFPFLLGGLVEADAAVVSCHSHSAGLHASAEEMFTPFAKWMIQAVQRRFWHDMCKSVVPVYIRLVRGESVSAAHVADRVEQWAAENLPDHIQQPLRAQLRELSDDGQQP